MKSIQKEHTRLRDYALYEAYKDALSSSREISHAEAVRMALRSPQPRMWVSFYGVYRALLCIVKGSRRPPKDASRARLIEEVRGKYEKLRPQRIFKGASLFFIASFIIAEPSCGFFLSEERAKRSICKIRKERRAAWREER